MKYLFLLLLLAGCARVELQKKNLLASVEEEEYKDPIELIFTKEELKQFKNLKEGESIPPDMSKVALIDTNLMDFPKDFWNDPLWLSNYREAVKNMPTNLSPQEATVALSNYLAKNEWEIISNQPFHTAAFYGLYHYAEQGADLSYHPVVAEDEKYYPESPILDMYIPELLRTVGQPSEKLYTDHGFLTKKELQSALMELSYIFDKEKGLLEYLRYMGWQNTLHTEVYKLFVKNGLDLNSFIDPSIWIDIESGIDVNENSIRGTELLYYQTIRTNPYTAYMLIALGYSNEAGNFKLTKYF